MSRQQNSPAGSADHLSRFLAFFFKKEPLLLLLILFVVFLSFSSALSNGFTDWDDQFYVTHNNLILGLDWPHIKAIFTSTVSRGYTPLTILSFAVEHSIFGLNPFVFHLDNVLLHLMVTALVFYLARRMGLNIWAAALGSLLFGIHPMRAESVAWMSERKDVLYAVFYLAAMHCYWTYLEKGKMSCYGWTLVCGCLSMLAKPMALSLPLVLWILDWMKGRRWTWKIIWEKIPYFFYIIPILWVTYRLELPAPPTPPMEAFLTWIWCATFYIWKFLFPVTLVPLYMRPEPVSLSNPAYLADIVSWILFVLVWIRFRRQKWLTFAWLFYASSIFFLWQTNLGHFNIVADRYMYLPGAGFCLFAGSLMYQGMKRLQRKSLVLKNIGAACLAALFLALSVKTFFQCQIWRNSESLFNVMINSQWGHNTLETIRGYLSSAYLNRGVAYVSVGKPDLAVKDYNSILEFNPDDYQAYNNRAIVHINNKEYDEALKDLNRAMAINPDFPEVYGNLGLVYLAQEKYDLAVDIYSRGLKIDPSSAALCFYRSQAYAHLNRFDEAVRDADKAQELGYRNGDAYFKSLKDYMASLEGPR